MGYVFCGLIICFGAFFNLVYYLLSKSSFDYLVPVVVNPLILILAWYTCYRINLKVNLDLKEGTKELQKRIVQKKIEETSWEAGSGTLFIPILGNLFPKLWGQGMSDTKKYYIFSDDNRYEVEKDVFNSLQKNDDFYLHIARHSDVVLNYSSK